MNEQEYIEQRLDDQINWYSKKSALNQRWHKRLKVIGLFLSAFIPVAVLLIDVYPWVKIIIAIAGAATAIITGIQGLYKYQENWIQYRTACETLKREKYMHSTKSGVYAEAPDSFKLLVERTENILSYENACWMQIQQYNATNQTNTPETGTSSSTGS